MTDQLLGPRGVPESFLFAGTTVEILLAHAETGGAFALLHITTPPNCWTPPHLHLREDETPLVLAGTLRVETAGQTFDLQAGDAIVLRRGQAHRLGNPGSEDSRVLLLCTPSGFDDFVRAAGRLSVSGASPQPMTDADVTRLVDMAPRFGITLTDEAELRTSSPAGKAVISGSAASVLIDVLGPTVTILAETGKNDDDLCLIRTSLSPGVAIPLHGHDAAETFYVVTGQIELFARSEGAGHWSRIGAGQVAHVPGEVRHALRNGSDDPADLVLVTTLRMARFLRAIGQPAANVPPGPPSLDRLIQFEQSSKEFGHWIGSPQENASIGLVLT